jgi:hypothetical protein
MRSARSRAPPVRFRALGATRHRLARRRTSGQTARFTRFQKKDPVSLTLTGPGRCVGFDDQATRRSPSSAAAFGAGSPMIRRSSAAMPSSTARFCCMRFDWL